MLQCLFIVRRGVNRVASRGLAPDGVIQLADDASSGVRLAVVCIVSVSVVVQYPLVAD